MSDFEIDFECQRAPFDFVPPTDEDKKSEHRAFGHLRRRGPLKKVRPTSDQLESAVNLLVKFVHTEDLPKQAAKIASALGTLAPLSESLGYEEMDFWIAKAWGLRQMFAGKFDENKKVGSLGIYLAQDKKMGVRLILKPASLYEALDLCAARMIATGTTLKKCEHCSTPFLRGGAGHRKRRGDARFCSDPCKWEYHNEARRRAKAESKT